MGNGESWWKDKGRRRDLHRAHPDRVRLRQGNRKMDDSGGSDHCSYHVIDVRAPDLPDVITQFDDSPYEMFYINP